MLTCISRISVNFLLKFKYPKEGLRLFSISKQEPENTSYFDCKDVQHHGKLAAEWWNRNSPMYPLMSMNQIRVPFIRDGLIATNKVNLDFINTTKVLSGVKLLEVGCGGGILTEALARINAQIVGIDPGEDVIQIAKLHLKEESPELLGRIDYKIEPIEIHSKHNFESYDAVIISEVIEHVDNKVQFLSSCVKALKPGGSVFLTTFNKTFLAWLGGIMLAENFFKFIPKGTHNFDKFINPIDVQRILTSSDCSTILVNGIFYDFWRDTWRFVSHKRFSYALQAVKNE